MIHKNDFGYIVSLFTGRERKRISRYFSRFERVACRGGYDPDQLRRLYEQRFIRGMSVIKYCELIHFGEINPGDFAKYAISGVSSGAG
jgi:hypothetical protein